LHKKSRITSSHLRRFGVGDFLLINPVGGLGVFGVVDLLGRVDSRIELLEEATRPLAGTVEEDLECIVTGADEIQEGVSVIRADVNGCKTY
jgi:hypothetical protein